MMIMRPPQHGHGRGSMRVRRVRCFGRLWFCWARRHSEQFASVGDVGGTVGAGEQAVMADAMEALWQYVAEEAANELGGIERHGFVAAGPFDPIILPLESDAGLVGRDQAVLEMATRWVYRDK